jgi:hypothetical protein
LSSHVGTVVIGGLPSEKEAAVAEELGGQHSSNAVDPNIPFKQGKPRCMPNLLTRVLYNLCFQMYCALHIGFEWSCRCIRMVYPSTLSLLIHFCRL